MNTKRMKPLLRVLLTLLLVLPMITNASVSAVGRGNDMPAIRVGSKDFTENLILAELYALALEENGYEVERVFNIGSPIIHTTIVNDEIDLYPEYTGTGLLSVLQLPMETDAQVVYDTVKAEYAEQFGLVWLDYSDVNDSQGLVITTSASEEYGIETISDLQENAANIRFASQGEFDVREDGIPGLEEVYGEFNWESSNIYDNSLKYQVLESGEADVAPAYTTEGRLVEDQFTLLEDDLSFWPPYNVAPVIRANILESSPDIETILNDINKSLDTETMTELNARVDIEQEEYEDVALDYFNSLN